MQQPNEVLLDQLFAPAPSDMTEVLNFLKREGVTLSQDQIHAFTLLRTLGGYEDIIQSVMEFRAHSLPTQHYRKVITEMAKAQAAANSPAMMAALGGDKKK